MSEHTRSGATKLVKAVVALALLAVAGLGSAQAQGAITNPDTYTYLRRSGPRTLDPGNAIDNVSLVVLADIYQRLVTLKRGDPTQVVGDVADTWSVSSDGLVYTFHVRKGLTFQDGSPLTAADVKYSLDRVVLMNGSAGLARDLILVKGVKTYLASPMAKADADAYMAAGGIQAPDASTVRITLNQPFTAFLPQLALFSFVVSKDYVEAHGGVTPGEINNFMSRNAMGSGPFAFKQWVPQQRIVLERYDGYWKGPAALKRVVVEFVPETGTRVLRLRTGDADYIELSAADADQVVDPATGKSKIDGVRVVLTPRFAEDYIFFNTKMKPFDDVDFREAMVYAFPYGIYLKQSLRGVFGQAANGVIPKGMFGYPEGRALPHQDLAKAKQLFEKAGFKGTVTMTIRSGRKANEQVALLLKDAVEGLGVGVKIDIQELASSTFVSKMRAGNLALYPNAWGADYSDPDTMVSNLYASTGFYPTQQGFKDPELDQMIAKARSEADPAVRKTMYADIVNAGEGQYLHIITDQPMDVTPIRTWLKGWQGSPLLWSKESYYLSKSETH
jgi:peptide/nickel transport system substrate-binding protein